MDSNDALAEDIYKTHNVLAEARVDMNGIKIVPAGETYAPLQPGKSAVFFWSLHSSKAAEHHGKIWLHLRLIPLDGSPEGRYLINAQNKVQWELPLKVPYLGV